MPKDYRKKDRRGKNKPYTKGNQNESANQDPEEGPTTCCICDEVIKQPTEDGQPGDDAVFCDGSCAGWFHRKCSGLSKSVYTMAGESDSPFYCVFCVQSVYRKEIVELKEQINTLTFKITQLLESLHGQNPAQSTPVSNVTDQASSSVPATTPKIVNKAEDMAQQDRNFNVVIYGIKECNKGTPRNERLRHDLDQVTAAVTEGENSINPLSICDFLNIVTTPQSHVQYWSNLTEQLMYLSSYQKLNHFLKLLELNLICRKKKGKPSHFFSKRGGL